jgi:hypothetical protein
MNCRILVAILRVNEWLRRPLSCKFGLHADSRVLGSAAERGADDAVELAQCTACQLMIVRRQKRRSARRSDLPV